MREVWKPIPGFSGYEASDQGRVRSIDRLIPHGKGDGTTRKRKGTILKPQPNKKRGRLYVALGKKVKLPVAVFVAMAFLGHKRRGFSVVVDHINGNVTDDRLENLQLVSQRKNIAKGYSVSKKKSGLPTGVSRTVRNKKPYMASIYLNGRTKFLGSFYTIEEASSAYQAAARKADKEAFTR